MIDFVYGLPVIALNRSDISSCGFETNLSYAYHTNLNFDLGYTYPVSYTHLRAHETG